MLSDPTHVYYQFAGIARMLRRDNHYEVDEEKRTVAPTEEGVARVERLLKVGSIYEQDSVDYVHQLQQALRAKELYHRDTDYIIAGGQVKIVDELTGRILEGQRWPDGLHQAVEAKERLAIKGEPVAAQPTLATPRPGPALIGRFDPDAAYPWDEDSMLRLVASEPAVGLLVGRALVMEVAHPTVGAAVAEHRQSRRGRLNRLWWTTDAAIRILFGGSNVARHATQQIYGVLDPISGTLQGPDLPHLAGLPETETPDALAYSARDATVLLWVWATLVDTLEVAFTRWVRPLAEAEATAYYADMAAGARFLGIPDELVPPDRQAFDAYLEQMLEHGDLGSTPTSEAMVHEVLWFRRPLLPSSAARMLRVLAILTLDIRLRDRLGLELGSTADRRLAERLDASLRRYYRRLPAWRHRLPYAYLALRCPTIGLGERLRHPSLAR